MTEEAERAKQRNLSLDRVDSAAEAQAKISATTSATTSATSLPTRFRCTTKALAVAGLALAVLHRHAVVNGCYVPIIDHFKGGELGCW